MAGIDRTTIIQGPALVTYNGVTFWSKGDVAVKPVQRKFGIEVAAFGKLEERNIDLRIEVTFEPAGQFTDAIAAVLWPYALGLPGTAMFGASDVPLVIWGRAGDKLTLTNAAVTQMPNLRFGVGKTSIGSVQFTGLVANSADPAAIASYWAWASAAYPGDTGFSMAEIWTPNSQGEWGHADFGIFETEAGWEFAFPITKADVVVDNIGTVGMRLITVNATASCIPIGPTAAEVLSALHGALAPGTASVGETLEVSGVVTGSPFVSMTAILASAETGYGTNRKRVGPCTWQAVRTFSGYVPAVESPPTPAVQAAMQALFIIQEVPSS